MPLNTDPNLDAPDDFYEQLIALHRGLSESDSARVNARLILLLANHIGDTTVLAQAMAAAREGIAPAAPSGAGEPALPPDAGEPAGSTEAG
jgi:hypothetical protein